MLGVSIVDLRTLHASEIVEEASREGKVGLLKRAKAQRSCSIKFPSVRTVSHQTQCKFSKPPLGDKEVVSPGLDEHSCKLFYGSN